MPHQLALLTQAPVEAFLRSPSNFHKGLLLLWKLAWKSRLRLSYLIIVAFMILDIHMTLEVRVDVGQEEFFIDPSDDDDTGDEEDDETDSDGGFENHFHHHP